MNNRKRLIQELEEIHKYIKAHHKYFHYKYESSITSMDKVKGRIKKKKKVGITCCIPLRLALYEMQMTRADGNTLLHATNGTFKATWTGKIKKNSQRITEGKVIGKTIKQAVDKGLLRTGDVIAFQNYTHTFVYSGEGYICYDGGSAAGDYSKGIKIDYSKHDKNLKIGEIIRWDIPKSTKTKEVKTVTKQIKFINKIAPMAVKDAAKSGILASITISQAILESGWGTSDLYKNANAIFGIKTHNWKGKTYTKESYEYEHGKKVLRKSVFRAYDNLQESISDHSDYLRTRKVDGVHLTYKAVVNETDYKKAAKALQKAGYSTYPNYAEMLIDIIKRYNLTKYDEQVKAATKKGTVEKPKDTATPSKAVDKSKTPAHPTKESKIFLDAGHGGKDSGATYGKRKESDDVLKLVLAIGKKLKAAGYKVGYSRQSDIYESPGKKAQDANDWKADYFFSFHRNCYNGKAHGYETLFYSHSSFKDAVMKDIRAKMKAIGFELRPDSQRKNLRVLNTTKAPALLFEVGFIDSKEDNKIFDAKFEDIVDAYVSVISKHCK